MWLVSTIHVYSKKQFDIVSLTCVSLSLSVCVCVCVRLLSRNQSVNSGSLSSNWSQDDNVSLGFCLFITYPNRTTHAK